MAVLHSEILDIFEIFGVPFLDVLPKQITNNYAMNPQIFVTKYDLGLKGIRITVLLLASWSVLSANRLPIATFPFLKNIANPCGLTDTADTSRDGSPIWKPFVTMDTELLKASQLALIIAEQMDISLGSFECNGLSLESLTPIPEFTNMHMEQALVAMDKALSNYLVHIYFISFKQELLQPYCRNATKAGQFNRLAGSLQYLLCNVVQALPDAKRTFIQAVRNIKIKKAFQHSSCSATEMKECLVVTGTAELLQVIIDYLDHSLFHVNNRLIPELTRRYIQQ